MFKKINRLAKKRDFENVFNNGKTAHSQTLSIRAVVNNQPDNRYAVVVGKKVSKKAVDRNKQKRWIREIIKQEASGLKNGFDVVVILHGPPDKSEKTRLLKPMQNNLRKLELYLDNQ